MALDWSFPGQFDESDDPYGLNQTTFDAIASFPPHDPEFLTSLGIPFDTHADDNLDFLLNLDVYAPSNAAQLERLVASEHDHQTGSPNESAAVLSSLGSGVSIGNGLSSGSHPNAFDYAISPNEPHSSTKRRRGSRGSDGGRTRRKSARTQISSEARTTLEKHFNSNPYPSDGELALLTGTTNLPGKAVRNWF
jgi:hypothetical protein